jgi:hypothetical protein
VAKRLNNKESLSTEISSSLRIDRGRNAYLRSLIIYLEVNSSSAALFLSFERFVDASINVYKRLRYNTMGKEAEYIILRGNKECRLIYW